MKFCTCRLLTPAVIRRAYNAPIPGMCCVLFWILFPWWFQIWSWYPKILTRLKCCDILYLCRLPSADVLSLMHQYKACIVYCFEYCSHGDSKYGHDIPKSWHFIFKCCDILYLSSAHPCHINVRHALNSKNQDDQECPDIDMAGVIPLLIHTMHS